MAAFKLLLSQARRHYLTHPHAHLHSSIFLRSLSSSSSPNPNESTQQPAQSVTIQAVSYPVKPMEDPIESSSNETPDLPPPPPPPQFRKLREPPTQEIEPRWTREEKPAVSISPVSYPTRVVAVEGGDRVEEEKVVRKEEGDDIGRERRRIETENLRRRVLRIEGEEEMLKVPFPTLIKVEKTEKSPVMDLTDVIRQVKANAIAGFDETVEAHVRLGIDRKRSDLTVRGSVTLPHGTGKAVRVAFFAEGADADEARAAGADIVGGVELVEELSRGGKINFDRCFTTPGFMPRMTKIARNLGPIGLMPNPKRGTVTSNVSGAVKEAKQGNIFFKMDKTAIVHVGLGKVSAKEVYLRDNICAFVNALLLAKPAGLKKTSKYAGYVNSFHICSTMGPGFPVSIQSISKAVDDYNKVHLK